MLSNDLEDSHIIHFAHYTHFRNFTRFFARAILHILQCVVLNLIGHALYNLCSELKHIIFFSKFFNAEML